MKQVIVLLSTIILGFMLVSFIIGDDEESLMSGMKRLWNSELEMKTVQGIGQ